MSRFQGMGMDYVWPQWFYGLGGQSKLCATPDDVPEGWEDHPYKLEDTQAPKVKTVKLAAAGMTRPEIMAALDAGGVSFQKNSSTAALNALLTENIIAALTADGTEFDPTADIKTLYALLTAE